jgi:hypothetical protein
MPKSTTVWALKDKRGLFRYKFNRVPSLFPSKLIAEEEARLLRWRSRPGLRPVKVLIVEDPDDQP